MLVLRHALRVVAADAVKTCRCTMSCDWYWACGVEHVVLTGGEPMLYSELIPLCESLSNHGCHITVETAGTLYLPLHCDLMSISPKLSNSSPAATSTSVGGGGTTARVTRRR